MKNMDNQVFKIVAELTLLPYPVPTQKRKMFVQRGTEKDVLNAFIHILSSNDKLTKAKVVDDILGKLDTEQAFNLLFYAMHDPDWHIRHKALDQLARKGRDVLPPIERWLNRDDLDPSVRGGLLSILANQQKLENTDDFIQVLHHGNFDAKWYAIVHLEKIKTKEVYDELRAAAIKEMHIEIRNEIRNVIKRFEDLKVENSSVENPLVENKNRFMPIFTSKNWFPDAVLHLRKLGFFQDYNNMSDDEIVLTLRDLVSCPIDYQPARIFDIQKIIVKDKRRVWFRDAETYHQNAYVKILNEWSDISSGSFAPKNIKEIWHSEKGPIQIEFEHNGQDFRINANYSGDWIDASIIPQVNEAFKDSGMQFCNVIVDSQELCVICLTDSQKKTLERDLGFEYEFIGRYIQPLGLL